MNALLKVVGLRVSLPVAEGTLHAVRGVDLSVSRGETVCLVGESGCGKSLTSLALMGLLPRRARVSASLLQFCGLDMQQLDERAMSDLRGNRIAMVFQDPMTSLNPSYTVGNQLEEVYLRHKPASRRQARERALYLLERVGIDEPALRLSQYPHQLSGGLRQRVMIAMALMCGPELIVADEPTTALDVTVQAQILRLLKDLQREFGMGLLLITHDLGVVARIADRVAVMYAGEVVEQGTAAEVFTRPLHPYTQGLLRCIPVPGRLRPGERLGSIAGLVPSLVGPVSGCAFANRCSHARAECRESAILVHSGASGHSYRCAVDPQSRMAKFPEMVA